MRHRHLDYREDTPVERLGPAAIDDLLDRGDLDDWRPLAAAVAHDPHGELADTVLHLIDAHPMYGTSPLWRAYIVSLRSAPPTGAATTVDDQPLTLAELRRRRGLTQAEVAHRLGSTQSEVSKLERRTDLKLSTLQTYMTALDAELELHARIGDSPATRITVN